MDKKLKENTIDNKKTENILGTKKIESLILKFAIPSIIAMLVSSLYNMVDQIFIGNYVGELGNAATNIAFPFTSLCTAMALACGIGGASAFNLAMGAGDKKNAGYYIGNAISFMIIVGFILAIISEIFMSPLLKMFGSPTDVLPFAIEYTRITALGFPLLIVSVGGGHLIRADGKPSVAMICNLLGAIVNTALDALFVIVLNMGMAGAAIATVIGQAVATALIIYHIFNFKTVKLTKENFIPNKKYILHDLNLGMSQGLNQIAMMIVQIVLNNSLKAYGAKSIYGESIPIAVVGIISKVNMIYASFCIGLSQGMQPIASYNYGAQKYKRTKEAYIKTIIASTVISIIAFVLFQVFPRQLTSIFGEGSEEYFAFAIKYFRIYLFCTFIDNVQPITSNFFSSIGKARRGVFLALTRQIIFLLPLILLLPIFMGIDGIMYAGPIADGLAFVISVVFVIRELKNPRYKEQI